MIAENACADVIELETDHTPQLSMTNELAKVFHKDRADVAIPAGAHHAWRNRSNGPIRMSTFFSPGGVEELYPKLVGLSLEQLSTVVEPFGSGIVGPPIDE